MNPHVPDIVGGRCDGVKLIQDVMVRLQLTRLEHRFAAALLIFVVDSTHVRSVEMDPLEGP